MKCSKKGTGEIFAAKFVTCTRREDRWGAGQGRRFLYQHLPDSFQMYLETGKNGRKWQKIPKLVDFDGGLLAKSLQKRHWRTETMLMSAICVWVGSHNVVRISSSLMCCRRNVEREVDIMNCLKSPRILQLYEAYDNGRNEMCLMTE